MIGDGYEMYDLITDILEEDLVPTNKIFWVGVIEHLYPSPPIPRIKTNCASPAKVFKHKDRLIFKMSDEKFYWLPKREMKFIQEIKEK